MKNYKIIRLTLGLSIISVFLFSGILYADAGLAEMNYQGFIKSNEKPFNGEGYFKFAIVNTKGDITWSNDATLSGEPISAISATVINGVFDIILGDKDIMTPFKKDIFSNGEELYLRVWFSSDSTNFKQGYPDKKIVASPYAMNCYTAEAIRSIVNQGDINNPEIKYVDNKWQYSDDGSNFSDFASAGSQGPVGPKGDKGDTGDKGLKGDKGDTGDTGDKGDKGDTGDTGPIAGTNQQLVYNNNGIAAGSDIYYDNTTGNVDIGGTIQTVGFKLTTEPGEGKILTSDASGLASWAEGATTYSNGVSTPVTIGGIPAGSNFSNQTMKEMWDALLYPYQAPAFTVFSSSPNIFTTFEVGEPLQTSSILSYSVSNSPNIKTQPPNSGAISTTISGASFIPTSPFTLASSDQITMNIPGGTTLNEPGSRSVTIEGTDSKNSKFTASGTIMWKYKRYSGMSTNNDTLTEQEIKDLTNKDFADSRAQTNKSFSTDNSEGEYIYFAWPESFDDGSDPTFSTSFGQWTFHMTTTTFTNDLKYNVYRSDNKVLSETITEIK